MQQSNYQIFAPFCLTQQGYMQNALISIQDGVIAAIELGATCPKQANNIGNKLLLPAFNNCHSHAFQRAMAGLTEAKTNENDSFWSWRQLMYQFLAVLRPEHIYDITAFAFMEMLESGYSAVGEFHYLHHDIKGVQYENPYLLSEIIMQAADDIGIGLTLLPVLYQNSHANGTKYTEHQARFVQSNENYSLLLSHISKNLKNNQNYGLCFHSLRAVSLENIAQISEIHPQLIKHIHISEQIHEVKQLLEFCGQTPINYLASGVDLSQNWHLVHATHATTEEIAKMARANAVVVICPITEANLGDGIFPMRDFVQNNGHFSIGTDSNVAIALSQELQILEYSQRLKYQARAVLSTKTQSSGRFLCEQSWQGGAMSLGRNNGKIAIGCDADLISIDLNQVNFQGKNGDNILDSWIFNQNSQNISQVWVKGRETITNGRHKNHEKIQAKYLHSLKQILGG